LLNVSLIIEPFVSVPDSVPDYVKHLLQKIPFNFGMGDGAHPYPWGGTLHSQGQ
jgi:hypothetical protein